MSYDFYIPQLVDIVESGVAKVSNIKPSEWVEQNIVMGLPFPGPYKYTRTPYCREIIDCLALDHPSRVISVMKGAQIGISAGVLIPGMGWIIKESPGNTYFTVGAPDLIDKASEKLDLMIDNAGLRSLIKPQITRKKAQKSGDTNTKKDFSGGYINITTPNNHKEWRDVSLKYGFIDDFEAAKSRSKESGSTRKLMMQRFAAYADSYKVFFISTPENKLNSNIEPAYLLGDQRKYMVPCPCCGAFIEIKWSIEKNGITGGITWKVDDHGSLVDKSVGYICQECGGFFDDKRKTEFLNEGYWNPTAKPFDATYYSYHITSLLAPLGMYDWRHYVNDWLEAHPVGQPRKERLYQTFVNVVLGECYEEENESPKANAIQKNTRPYNVGAIPERLSQADGNGNIVMITCAADMNGKMEEGNHDVRLDYEILAWAESGATYSISHGSIGTFIPRESPKQRLVDRKKWTYEEKKPNSVWPEFEKILDEGFKTDTGREMKIMITGLDCGHHSTHAYNFIDKTNYNVYGLKGKGEDKYIRFGQDMKVFKHALERQKLYILEVGLLKDRLGEYMLLNWHDSEMQQPANFMNFPEPGNGLYQFTNYFEHFESEHRVLQKNEEGEGISARWVKKTSTSQNHMWDCRVYNLALQEIILDIISKSAKRKIEWAEFCNILQGKK